MLTIYGQELDAVLFDSIHDQLAAGDQGLFIGKSDILAGVDRRERRRKPDHPDNGIHDQIRLFVGSRLDQTVHPAEHLGIGIGNGDLKKLRFLLIKYHGDIGRELPDLLLKQLDIAVSA